MKFSEIIDQATELLQRKGRVTYRVLKREFALNDEALEDLKEELIDAEHVATDEDGRILVWAGEAPSTEASDAPIVQPSAPIPSPDLSSPESHQLLQAEPTVVGERRQLTVMFCDLVGSTALSEKLDPEDLHALIRSYQEICAEVIQRYDGYIAQYLGDGLLIYFGYPAAHEDDAQRAVRAGLEIPDQLHKLPSAHPLQVRIGIHTGQVVVGEIGEGDKREQLALGDTPNIAARVQGKAEPDAVIISAETYHLVQGWFECQDLGPQDLKGISAPLSLYRIQGESQAQSRFEVAIQTGLTPFVGREEEAELLRRLWVRAKGGDGQVVLVSGEAGIGKSRLLQVLSEAIGTEPHERVACRCSAFHQNSALYPIIDRLQEFLQFEREDELEVKLGKLEHALKVYGFYSDETLSLFAALLSLSLPDTYPPLNLSPQKQKEKTFDALITWLQKAAEEQPVRLEIEDLHWADPSTLELLGGAFPPCDA